MSKKYTMYAALTCVLFIIILLTACLILDLALELNWQLVIAMALFCAGCIPLWLILGDVLSQYYESEAKRRNRRKLVVIPYSVPTKSDTPIVFTKTNPDSDVKVYKDKQGRIELRHIITDCDEAATQIYSIKKHAE